MEECIHGMTRDWCAFCSAVEERQVAQSPQPVVAGPSLRPTLEAHAELVRRGADRSGVLEPERSSRWVEYDKWNSAFCDVIFGGAHAFEPVFLDVEDDLLMEVARARGLELAADAAEAALGAAVRRALILDSESAEGAVFSLLRQRLDSWHSQRRGNGSEAATPPPVIALLAVFARAAELMGHDESFRTNAYRPRLHQLLEVAKADENRLYGSFIHECESFWGSLNEWLDSAGGSRGLPTARAIGHRYVGIALSQALLRDADHRLLEDFFESQDLEPGLQLSADDMSVYLEAWVSAGKAPSSIQNLWRTPAGKKVLAEAAALSLARWDGTAAQSERNDARAVRPLLTARVVKSGLARTRLRLGFALRGTIRGQRGLPRRWIVTSAPGDSKPEVELETLSDRLVAPDLKGEIDSSSLLEGELRLQAEDGLVGAPQPSRRPQPLVVLSRLDEAGVFVEVERVRLLEPHMLLVNAAARRFTGPSSIDLDGFLDQIAEPGYDRVASMPGLPAGWVLYRNVTIVVRHDSTESLLDPLKPGQTTTHTVGGGLRLPGHTVRWHADIPLQIRASVGDAEGMTLRLLKVGANDIDDLAIRVWNSHGSELEVSTARLELAPGAYRTELESLGATPGQSTKSAATWALCDSDGPRVRADAIALGYHVAAGAGSVTAGPVEPLGRVGEPSPEALVAGAVGAPDQGGLSAGAGALDQVEMVWWRHEATSAEAKALAEPAPPGSCTYTGAHYWKIETHQRWMRYDRAECIHCGRVRFYRPTARKKTDPQPRRATLSKPFGRLGTASPDQSITGDTVLDALVWLGGGSADELARVIRQVNDDALTVDEVARALEALGHIDIARDAKSFAADGWAVSPRCLAGLEDGSWLVVGSWTRSALAKLTRAVAESGALLEQEGEGWLPQRRLTGLSEAAARNVASASDAAVVPHAGRRILSALPPLTRCIGALHRVSAEGIFDAEWYNPATSSWTKTESIAQPGAYRLNKGFISNYLFRGPEDVAGGKAARASAQLVKHLASAQRPLVGYDAAQRMLFVPLGADLPGLYGRALTLMSGQPPTRVQGSALLAYSAIAPDVAAALVRLLKG